MRGTIRRRSGAVFGASLVSIILAGLLAGGCPATTPAPSGTPDGPPPYANVQQNMPTGEFQQIAAEDPELQERLDAARALHGTDAIHSSGVIRDTEGTELIWAALDLDDPGDAVVVRHCRNGDCVHAIQRFVGGEQEIIWTSEIGEIEPRTVLLPFQLRDYDETTGQATLATPSPDLLATATAKASASSAAERATKAGVGAAQPRCGRFRALSAFGKFFNGISDIGTYLAVSGLADTMRNIGCTNATESYNATRRQVDQQLSGMGPDDIFVLYAHGDRSRSKGRVVGMSLSNSRVWNSGDHYSEADFRRQFDDNIFGGPGIVFLAGCASADMLPQLDDPEHPQRVIIGFSRDHFQTNVYNAMKLFFERYAACDSIQEAMDAVNASPGMARSNVRLVANASADLTRRLCEEEPPSDEFVTLGGAIWTPKNESSPATGLEIELLGGATVTAYDFETGAMLGTTTSTDEALNLFGLNYEIQIPKPKPPFIYVIASKAGYGDAGCCTSSGCDFTVLRPVDEACGSLTRDFRLLRGVAWPVWGAGDSNLDGLLPEPCDGESLFVANSPLASVICVTGVKTTPTFGIRNDVPNLPAGAVITRVSVADWGPANPGDFGAPGPGAGTMMFDVSNPAGIEPPFQYGDTSIAADPKEEHIFADGSTPLEPGRQYRISLTWTDAGGIMRPWDLIFVVRP